MNRWNLATITGLLLMMAATSTMAQSEMELGAITLKGKASGGTVTLTKAPGWNYPYVVVETQPGATPAEVMARIALELGGCRACSEYYGPVQGIRGDSLMMGGSGGWVFGGTDAGFAIPHPPTDLSVSYNEQRGEVSLEWRNPAEKYDSIKILYYSSTLVVLPGDATHYVHKRGGSIDAGFSPADITVSVMGYRDGVPSNVLVTRLRKQAEQDVLLDVPFTQGLAPGFTAWNAPGKESTLTLVQGNLPGMEPKTDPRKFLGKGFYQILKGSGEFSGGVSRTFTGLQPGHTYRVAARMNTLDTKAGDWSFSLHAAPGNSESPMSPAQLAGTAALPGGARGVDAGLISRLDGDHLTSGAWVEKTSGGESGAADLLVPSGASTLTVWFRLNGTGEVPGVGFDSLSLTDLGVQLSQAK